MKLTMHNLSGNRLQTLKMGFLYPSMRPMEILPNDTVKMSSKFLLRVDPLYRPVMHPVKFRVHNWYVRNRNVWPDWTKFIVGDDSVTIPTITVPAQAADCPLLDYLGLDHAPGREINAMPIYAFNTAFNENYRDQDLVTERQLDDLTIPHIAWEKDYFTTARPWQQKGTVPTLPNFTAPVKGIGIHGTNGTFTVANPGVKETGETANTTFDDASAIGTTTGDVFYVEEDPDNAGFPNIRADLNGMDATQLRKIEALQRYAERRARFGSRYFEWLLDQGSNVSARELGLPEYLSGGSNTISFSEVLQTAEGTSPVGEMKGHGITALRSNSFLRRFDEHGYLFQFVSIRPKTIYKNAWDRHWMKTTKEDYYQKELEFVGQQELWNGEIYAQHTDPKGTFGWQNRYSEYTYPVSDVAGEMRDTVANDWHMARIHNTEPVLNDSFVECDATDRIFAAGSTIDQVYLYAKHNILAGRMPKKISVGRLI